MNYKKTLKLFISVSLTAIFIFFPLAALAQEGSVDNLLWGGFKSDVQDITGLGNDDPRVTAGGIINVLLGFMGIIAFLLFIFGGLRWMTSGGDEEAAAAARGTMIAGIIGLIFVLSAFAIADFLTFELFEATNAIG